MLTAVSVISAGLYERNFFILRDPHFSKCLSVVPGSPVSTVSFLRQRIHERNLSQPDLTESVQLFRVSTGFQNKLIVLTHLVLSVFISGSSRYFTILLFCELYKTICTIQYNNCEHPNEKGFIYSMFNMISAADRYSLHKFLLHFKKTRRSGWATQRPV